MDKAQIETPQQEDQPKKSSSVTYSERLLAKIARHSFLTLWNYPNLYTDEGRKDWKGDGRELCDLMVVFDNDIILFSDKHCNFPQHNDINIAWARWYKRAVAKSVNQLLGAESWVRRFPERIFLDRQCNRRLPVPIPNPKNAQFHRIAVTRGSYEKCAEFFGGGSTGSLFLNTRVHGAAHLSTPFTVGIVAPNHGYVHVLDELTLGVVLGELDTISDLVSYLRKKEVLLTKPGRTVMATGEEQLVAMYVTTLNKTNEHDFPEIPEHINSVFFEEGKWEGMIRNPQYIAKKKADRVSYAWDRLIEHFTARGDDLGGNVSAGGTRTAEPALRVLASAPRLHRRQLAEELLDALQQKVGPGQKFARLGVSRESPDTAYVYLILPQPDFIKSYAQYREGRKAMLLAHCKVAKLRAPKAKRILGIAAEPAGLQGGSEDLILLKTDGENWNSDNETEARDLQERMGIFRDDRIAWRETHAEEYPEPFPPANPDTTMPMRPTMNRAQRRALQRRQRREEKRRRPDSP